MPEAHKVNPKDLPFILRCEGAEIAQKGFKVTINEKSVTVSKEEACTIMNFHRTYLSNAGRAIFCEASPEKVLSVIDTLCPKDEEVETGA